MPGHVGPDLERARLELGREVGCRGVRAPAAEKHALAPRVAGDEALREGNAIDRGKSLLQGRIGVEVAAGREVRAALVGARHGHRAQQRPGIQPGHGQSLLLQVGGTEPGGQQFAHRHDPGLDPRTDFPDEVDAGHELLQFVEVLAQLPRTVHAEAVGQPEVQLLEVVDGGPCFLVPGTAQELVEPVGDGCEGRVDHDRPKAVGLPLPDQAEDGLPALGSGHAGAAELQDDPGRRSDGRLPPVRLVAMSVTAASGSSPRQATRN